MRSTLATALVASSITAILDSVAAQNIFGREPQHNHLIPKYSLEADYDFDDDHHEAPDWDDMPHLLRSTMPSYQNQQWP